MNKALLALALAVTLTVVAQTALSPRNPAIPSPSGPVVVPASPVTTVSGFTNTFNTNALAVQLTPLLLNLQVAVEQTLPTLTFFNDGFDFVDTTGTGAAPAATTAASPSSTVSNGLGVSLSPGTSLATTTTAPVGSGSTGLAAFPATRDTLRRLLILQAQLEQILPLLNAVNNGNAGITTNQFGQPFIPPATGP